MQDTALVTKALHWVIFAIMSIQFGVGYLMTRVDDDPYESIPGLSEDRLFGVHMSLGASVLLLALLRLAWRMATPLPSWAPTLTTSNAGTSIGSSKCFTC